MTVTLQITYINTWQDKSQDNTQSKGDNSLWFIKEYKIKHFSTSYLLWEKYHNIAYSSNKYTIKSIILSLVNNQIIATSRQLALSHLRISFSIVYTLKK